MRRRRRYTAELERGAHDRDGGAVRVDISRAASLRRRASARSVAVYGRNMSRDCPYWMLPSYIVRRLTALHARQRPMVSREGWTCDWSMTAGEESNHHCLAFPL